MGALDTLILVFAACLKLSHFISRNIFILEFNIHIRHPVLLGQRTTIPFAVGFEIPLIIGLEGMNVCMYDLMEKNQTI